MHESEKWKGSRSVVFDSSWPHGPQPTRLLCPWDFPGKSSKVMLRILKARLQQYVNRELLDVQAGFRKGMGIRGQIAVVHWIIEKARQFQKNIYFSSGAMVKNLPANAGDLDLFPAWGRCLEEEMATHSIILARQKTPWTEKPGGLQSMGSQRVRHDWMTAQRELLLLHWLH